MSALFHRLHCRRPSRQPWTVNANTSRGSECVFDSKSAVERGTVLCAPVGPRLLSLPVCLRSVRLREGKRLAFQRGQVSPTFALLNPGRGKCEGFGASVLVMKKIVTYGSTVLKERTISTIVSIESLAFVESVGLKMMYFFAISSPVRTSAALARHTKAGTSNLYALQRPYTSW
jgi:hypothetical protein